MPQEIVDLTNGQIRQNFKTATEQNATLLTEIQEWGASLTRVGEALSAHPDAIVQVDLRGLPSFRESHRAIQELINLQAKLASLGDLVKKLDTEDRRTCS